MSVPVADDNSLKEFIIDTFFASVTKTPAPKYYRYYHCSLDSDGLKCKKVFNPNVTLSKENTKLLFVKSSIPEVLDTTILKYKWIPDRVYIEDNST